MRKTAQTFNELANASGEGQEPERHRTSVRCLSLFLSSHLELQVTQYGGSLHHNFALRNAQSQAGDEFRSVMCYPGSNLRAGQVVQPSFLRLADEVPMS
jgi:hypothetical protein